MPCHSHVNTSSQLVLVCRIKLNINADGFVRIYMMMMTLAQKAKITNRNRCFDFRLNVKFINFGVRVIKLES